MKSASFYGSSKSRGAAIEIKDKGNDHYKHKRYYSAVRTYSKALLYCPWPFPLVLNKVDDCIRGLDLNVKRIIFEDLLLTRKVTEPYDSLPSLLGQCYGNRSAALYELGKHEDVVADIDRALEAGFKKPQIFKLYKRKASSLVKLGKIKEARRVVDLFKEGVRSKDSGLSSGEKEKFEKDIIGLTEEITLGEKKEKPVSKPKVKPEEPFISPMVSIEKSQKLGRHLKSLQDFAIQTRQAFDGQNGAKEDIPHGTCIVYDTPFVSHLGADYAHLRCSFCFKETLTIIPCLMCWHPGYCQNECMYKGFRYHWLECKFAKEWGTMNWLARMALRMILVAPKHLVQTLIKEGYSLHSIDAAIDKAKKGLLVIPESYLLVLNLVAHRGKYETEEQKRLIEKVVDEWEGSLDPYPLKCQKRREALIPMDYLKKDLIRFFNLEECHARSLYDLLRYHMCQIRFNTCTVSVNTLAMVEDEKEDVVKEVVKQKIGIAIYLTASMFNHSCDPNVFFRYEGNCVRAIALFGTNKGEELVHCYGPQLGRLKIERRKITLKQNYMFDCTCKACFDPDEDALFKEYAWDALSCPDCGGVLPVLYNIYKTNCLKCGIVFELNELLEQRDKAKKLYTEGVKEKSLKKLLECEKIQNKVLCCSNLDLAKTRDAIAYLFVAEGQLDEALSYCLDSHNAVKDIFGIGSIEAAEELSKVAQLLFQCGCIRDALKTTANVLPLLELYYGPDHVDVVQLKHLRDNIEKN